jgi:hypothetical protein
MPKPQTPTQCFPLLRICYYPDYSMSHPGAPEPVVSGRTTELQEVSHALRMSTVQKPWRNDLLAVVTATPY